MVHFTVWITLSILIGSIYSEEHVHEGTPRFGFGIFDSIRTSFCNSSCKHVGRMAYIMNFVCALKCPEMYVHSNGTSMALITTGSSISSMTVPPNSSSLPSNSSPMPSNSSSVPSNSSSMPSNSSVPSNSSSVPSNSSSVPSNSSSVPPNPSPMPSNSSVPSNSSLPTNSSSMP